MRRVNAIPRILCVYHRWARLRVRPQSHQPRVSSAPGALHTPMSAWTAGQGRACWHSGCALSHAPCEMACQVVQSSTLAFKFVVCQPCANPNSKHKGRHGEAAAPEAAEFGTPAPGHVGVPVVERVSHLPPACAHVARSRYASRPRYAVHHGFLPSFKGSSCPHLHHAFFVPLASRALAAIMGSMSAPSAARDTCSARDTWLHVACTFHAPRASTGTIAHVGATRCSGARRRRTPHGRTAWQAT